MKNNKLKTGPKPRTREEVIRDFWQRVNVAGPDDCWEWQGAQTKRGYGVCCIDGRNTTAHRIAYAATHNEDIKGLDVCHRCDNPKCCNPRHLFKGSRSVNMQDMASKGRHGFSKQTTWEMVRDIRSKHRSGQYLIKELAQMFDKHIVTIQHIIYNKSWVDPNYQPPKGKE